MNPNSLSRIALVISQLRPGGAERVVVHVANGLRRRGVEPLVACIQEKGELASELESRDVEVVALQSLRGYDVKAVVQLALLFRRFKPDVINVHDYSSLPYVAVAGLTRRKCPIIFTGHGLLYEGFETLQRRLRFFSRRVNTLAAVSPQVRDRHVSYLDWRGTTQLIPNGVEDVLDTGSGDRIAMRKSLGIADDAFVFLAVGNPRPEKAFEDLVAATVDLQQASEGRPFHVLIVGKLSDNEYCDRLRRAVQASGVEGLRLLGYRDDVQRLYSAADAFVLSSHSEGLPMVILEAMTAGLPIIGTDVGGIAKAVPAECGFIEDPRRPDRLAARMCELLLAREEKCVPMGRAAREWALSEFGIEKMIDRYLEVYGQAVQQRTNRR